MVGAQFRAVQRLCLIYAGAYEYGKQLRELSTKSPRDFAENLIRECYMKSQIENAMNEYPAEKIVAVTGAFHTEGLKTCTALTPDEISSLPSINSKTTLMSYSYYRLSARSGYGAGNKAPAYYELVWEGLNRGDKSYAKLHYMSTLADYQRKNGGIISYAEVIEAIRLADTLAGMKGTDIPTLADLRDSAVTAVLDKRNHSPLPSAAALDFKYTINAV